MVLGMPPSLCLTSRGHFRENDEVIQFLRPQSELVFGSFMLFLGTRPGVFLEEGGSLSSLLVGWWPVGRWHRLFSHQLRCIAELLAALLLTVSWSPYHLFEVSVFTAEDGILLSRPENKEPHFYQVSHPCKLKAQEDVSSVPFPLDG